MKYYEKMSIKNICWSNRISRKKFFFVVNYLVKSKFREKYTFPKNDDVDEIDIEQIIQKLDEPMFDNWGHYALNF